MPLTVTIAGFTFNAELIQSDGDVLVIDDIEGWDAPPVELSQHPTMGTGDHVSWGRYVGQDMTVKGHAFCPIRGNHWRPRRKIAAAFSAVAAEVTMTVIPEDDLAYSVQIRRNGPIQVSKFGPHVIEFSVPILNPSAVKTAI